MLLTHIHLSLFSSCYPFSPFITLFAFLYYFIHSFITLFTVQQTLYTYTTLYNTSHYPIFCFSLIFTIFTATYLFIKPISFDYFTQSHSISFLTIIIPLTSHFTTLFPLSTILYTLIIILSLTNTQICFIHTHISLFTTYTLIHI